MEEKDAILELKLIADSGYQSEEKVRISPKQWGQIMKIIHDKKENEWIPIDYSNINEYSKAAKNNCWLKFDDGSTCRYNDDWSFNKVTHYKYDN